jgi:hypothetical protein
VSFGGEVHNRVDFELVDDALNQFGVADVAFYEFMILVIFKAGEIFEISRVSELVEINDKTIRLFAKYHPHEIAAYEAGSACNE